MGLRNGSAVSVPRSIFNRCTAVYLAGGIFAVCINAAAIRAKFLLARFSLNAPSACLAANRLKSISHGALAGRSRALRSREFSGMLLIEHRHFSPQSGEKPHLINVEELTLNQRVQGSSPCAPTNKINILGPRCGLSNELARPIGNILGNILQSSTNTPHRCRATLCFSPCVGCKNRASQLGEQLFKAVVHVTPPPWALTSHEIPTSGALLNIQS